MKPEKEQLLHELLEASPAAQRTATLLAGARILRRRRQWRAASRVLILALVLLTAGFWVENVRTARRTNPVPMVARGVSAPAAVPILTDDQLLALFPGTPVGLVTLADGKKRLVFPRPGDERKFMNHL